MAVDVLAFLGRISKLSYFQILGLSHDWHRAPAVKQAFHGFASLYHPDHFAGASDEEREAAREVFKRAVEAYEVLREPELQKRYVERYLKKGKLRLPPNAFGKVDPSEPKRPKTLPPEPKVQTWVDEMQTEDGRQVAARIERMIAGNNLQPAYQQFGILEQVEPGNPAVKRKLAALKKRMGLLPDHPRGFC